MRFLCESTERENEILGREGENIDGERESGMGFISGTIILVLTDGPKST